MFYYVSYVQMVVMRVHRHRAGLQELNQQQTLTQACQPAVMHDSCTWPLLLSA